MSSSSTQALWYLTRATGLVSLVLLTLVMVLGIAQVQRWTSHRYPRFVTAALHRNVSLLAVLFLGVHISTSVLDSYAPISLVSAFVPFTSPYRPLWLGFGALALDLIVALVATSLLRPRINHGLWRTIHWAAYACWPLALVHGLGTGSDGRIGWVQVLDAACLLAVLAALAWRLAANWQVAPARRTAGALGSSLAVVIVIGWAAVGPTRPNWARRAGTPPSLLRSSGTTSRPPGPSGVAGSTTTTSGFVLAGQARFDGTLSQTGDASQTSVVIVADLTGGLSGKLQIDLEGRALDDGGLALRRGSVTIGPASQPGLYSGPVTQLDGADLTATVRTSAGRSATAQVHLEIDPNTRRVSGVVDVR